MARGYALEGDTSKARNAFEEFFEFWKEANTDVPILRQARVECAKLK